VNNALIIGNKEIKTGITGTGTEGFYKLFHYRRDGDISDGDGIEQMEVMYDTEGAPVAFDHTEPPGSVSSIGRFIHTEHYFVMDDFDEFVVETRRDGCSCRPTAYAGWLGCALEGRNLAGTLPFPLQPMIDRLPALLPNYAPASPLLATRTCLD
jgi:hypothetical protein